MTAPFDQMHALDLSLASAAASGCAPPLRDV